MLVLVKMEFIVNILARCFSTTLHDSNGIIIKQYCDQLFTYSLIETCFGNSSTRVRSMTISQKDLFALESNNLKKNCFQTTFAKNCYYEN